MPKDPKTPPETPRSESDENDATELTEEELQAVAGAGIRYNFARSSSDTVVASQVDPFTLKRS